MLGGFLNSFFLQHGSGSVPALAADIAISDETSSKPSPNGWTGLVSLTLIYTYIIC